MARAKTSRRRKSSSGLARYLTTERVIIGGALLITALFFVFIIVDGISRQPPDINLSTVPDNSVAFASQGRNHIQEGELHPAYNSDPPTSGWHYPRDARLGVYTTPIADETLVHNLEHGHVWLSYRDADDQEALDLLRDIQRRYPQNVIVTYRPQNSTRIAAVAWGRLLALDEPDADQLYAFVLRYRNRAPENLGG